MATRRPKAYIWVTHLAKLLGGNQCTWAAWFKSHFWYDKYQEMAGDLVQWNRDHDKLMAARRRALEKDGWTVTVEDDNKFKLEGKTVDVAGKMDLVAVKGDQVLVIDGKTGRERDSDMWQVLIYLYALPKCRPDLKGSLEGEVHYKHGDVALTPAELTPKRMEQLVTLIKTVGGNTPPPKRPSREECKRCDIGIKDCPERITRDVGTVAVSDF